MFLVWNPFSKSVSAGNVGPEQNPIAKRNSATTNQCVDASAGVNTRKIAAKKVANRRVFCE